MKTLDVARMFEKDTQRVRLMKKKVLLAIDMEFPTLWAASYALHLAARLGLSLAVMMVFPEGQEEATLDDNIRIWLGKLQEQCNREDVSIELFLGYGKFGEEVSQFSNSKSFVQFIVTGVSNNRLHIERIMSQAQIFKKLYVQQGVETLLVWSHGKVGRLREVYENGNFGEES